MLGNFSTIFTHTQIFIISPNIRKQKIHQNIILKHKTHHTHQFSEKHHRMKSRLKNVSRALKRPEGSSTLYCKAQSRAASA